MANRPRRPRTGGTQAPAPEGTSPSETGRVDGAEIAAADEPAATPVVETPSATDADQPADAAPKGPQTALPAPQDQPEAANAGERRRQSDPDGSSADSGEAPGTEGEPSATETFAAEEGLAAKAGEPPRRDLGEFEDDDASPNDRTSPANPPVSDAYRDRTASASAPEVGHTDHTGKTPFGALVGAGVAGAVLALLGAALLSSAGLFPGGQAAQETGQFAQAGDLEAVSSEVATLREAVGQLQSAEAAGGTGESYASATDLAAVSDRLAAAEQTLQQRAGTIEESSGAAQAAQDTADSAQSAASDAQSRVDEIASRMDDVETRISEIQTANEQARVALSAAGLKAAIDRGGPFMPELEAFAAAGGDQQAIEPLREFAANGVPTQAELVSRWPDVEADIRRAIVQPDAEAGIGGQLMAGFSSLVTVRSTDDPGEEASGANATLARMSSALQAGDLEGWLSARDELDEPARQASADFAAEVQARQQASSVVDAALAGATGGATDTQG